MAYLDPYDYAEARALLAPDCRVRQPGRPGARFLTAFCVIAPTETFH